MATELLPSSSPDLGRANMSKSGASVPVVVVQVPPPPPKISSGLGLEREGVWRAGEFPYMVLVLLDCGGGGLP